MKQSESGPGDHLGGQTLAFEQPLGDRGDIGDQLSPGCGFRTVHQLQRLRNDFPEPGSFIVQFI
ncbi:hypothetical protein D1872_290430 [compost metagenome]